MCFITIYILLEWKKLKVHILIIIELSVTTIESIILIGTQFVTIIEKNDTILDDTISTKFLYTPNIQIPSTIFNFIILFS